MSRVAVLRTTPETVVEDYGRLMDLAGYREAGAIPFVAGLAQAPLAENAKALAAEEAVTKRPRSWVGLCCCFFCWQRL